jgi:D-alanine-D-alanine ligase
MTLNTSSLIEKTASIAVLAGGLSSEREVSLRSGKNCLAALHRLGYSNAYLLDADHSLPAKLLANRPDVAFIILHGAYGEDGAVQGLLEWFDIPYTGNRLRSSAIAMDKALTKSILKDAGLPVLAGETVTPQSFTNANAWQALAERTSYPVMVKPLGGGSSIGMSKVDSPEALKAAVELAFKQEPQALLEPYFKGRDLTVGVIQLNGELKVTPILELRCPNHGWYSLEAKYTAGATEFHLPAPLPAALTEAIQQTTLKAHQALGCTAVSRIDFVTDGESHFYILEINTSPGMTDLSDLPAQCKEMCLSYDELVEALLQTAVVSPSQTKTPASTAV